MSKVVESDLDAASVQVAVMEDGELARDLERVFQVFCRAQQDWAVTHSTGQSTGDMQKDADASDEASRKPRDGRLWPLQQLTFNHRCQTAGVRQDTWNRE